MTISPKEFIDTWAASALREQQGAQTHFNMLCELVGHLPPAQADPSGETFAFEEHVEKATGGKGRADVWKKDHFAWEYKGKHRDLDAAYGQLLAYRGGLGNPPLLVVCDFLEYRIYPQWPNASAQPFKFRNQDLTDPLVRRYITWLLESPEKFLELRQDELSRRERVTRELAEQFAEVARLMRVHRVAGEPLWTPMQIARFLAKLTFVMFANDIGLLPNVGNQTLIEEIFSVMANAPHYVVPYLKQLFEAMDGQAPVFLTKPIPYFNGGLFADSAPGAGDGTEALDITKVPPIIDMIKQVNRADWRYVNPSIFGTLFEAALDESKRAQLGAHYTSEDDIRLIIEPVLMEPLNRQWAAIQPQVEPLMQVFLHEKTVPKARKEAEEQLLELHDSMIKLLEETKVLDPACGSGNFLYVALKALKDLEGKVRQTFEPLDLPFRDVVTPRQLYGIEKDEFAARLAQIVVWIGYLQWRYEDDGVLHPHRNTSRPHPRQLPSPIFQDKYDPNEPDHIQCADAIMRYDESGEPHEPEWPAVSVIVSNPPFLGGKRMRTELDRYVDDLFKVYKDRVPHEADLVCYWYEKARTQIETKKAKRVGMLATNSIRGGANRVVLDRIKQTGDIFMAWSDREWVLEGAAVRISVVGFDDGSQKEYTLDGAPVIHINSDLQNTIDATKVRRLRENIDISLMADTKGGAFDIPADLARKMLQAQNRSGHANADVVRPWVNGLDIVRRPRNMWIIDFGTNMKMEEAKLYRVPFQYIEKHVLPERQKNRRASYKEKWWIHVEPRPKMRQAIQSRSRYIATVALAKHRLFVWLSGNVLADHQLIVFARDDDYFFGVLHSYAHEIWSLRLGTSLEDRPRYTPTTTFETYPFPYSPGKEPADSPEHRAISEAVKQLHEERDRWLNPPELLGSEKALKERTLTNLYNALEEYRQKQRNGNGNGNGNMGHGGSPARAFAPRLAELHAALDRAVLAAYGWPDLADRLRTPDGDEELLRRLLALNVQRSGA